MEEKLEKKKKKKKKKKKEHDSDSESDSDSDDEKEDPLTVIQRLQDEHETFLKRVARRRSAEHLLIATKALRCTANLPIMVRPGCSLSLSAPRSP